MHDYLVNNDYIGPQGDVNSSYDVYRAMVGDVIQIDFENDETSVEIMIRSSQDVVSDLLSYGVDFQKDEDGSLAYTREGAHSNKRIVFHKDITGKEAENLLDSIGITVNIMVA